MNHAAGTAGGGRRRYGMVIDINRCVGCQTCTIACKHGNDTPPGVQWRRVLDVERGEFPDVERLFLVVGCQHCAEPPCVPVCPTGATAQREDGLVTMDYDRCIGCGYCAVACPYQARTIEHERRWYFDQPTRQEQQVLHDERLGVATKCTFCVEKVDAGHAAGARPGEHPDHTPACAASCIAQAIRFGDFADPASEVSALVRDNASFQMHAELGTDPQIKYLYEVPVTTPGRDPAPGDLGDGVMSDPENPLVGSRQAFWDARAAMNFTLGGMSSGLAVMAFLAHLVSAFSAGALLALYLVSAAGMAIGLFFVFLEIGRKRRFLYVLLRPRTSWMTRETYAVAAFYPAVVADQLWPGMALHAAVAAAAGAFLYCQARILNAALGIPAWRAPLIPGLLALSGLLEGLGLLLVARALWPELVLGGSQLAVVALVLAVVNFWLWRHYCATAAANGIGPLARHSLARVTPWLHLVGHAAPVALFALALAAPWGAALTIGAAGLGGAAAVAGGVLWKFVLITRACHQQGFAVPKMPRRGSGTRAAPVRLEAPSRSAA